MGHRDAPEPGLALDLLNKNETTAIHEATLHVAVTQIAQALRRFDPNRLTKVSKSSPPITSVSSMC